MPYNRYEGLDGKVKAFNVDKGVVWRRSRLSQAIRVRDDSKYFMNEIIPVVLAMVDTERRKKDKKGQAQ